MTPKTAATLTPEEIQDFRAKLKFQKYTLDQQTQARLDKARQVAGLAAGLLKKEFSARRVVLFGSLVTPDIFHSRSDIDLAAWGIPGRDYYRAVGVLQSLDAEFSIDLILFEEASTRLQKAILAEGVEL
jgi:predicted nucleotidyltransferase